MLNTIADFFDEHETGVAIALSILFILLSLGIAFGMACLWGWVFMLVWNNLLPLLWAEASTIGFWLAVGIVLIVRVLFKTTVTVNNRN
jgi:hypothetical protein